MLPLDNGAPHGPNGRNQGAKSNENRNAAANMNLLTYTLDGSLRGLLLLLLLTVWFLNFLLSTKTRSHCRSFGLRSRFTSVALCCLDTLQRKAPKESFGRWHGSRYFWGILQTFRLVVALDLLPQAAWSSVGKMRRFLRSPSVAPGQALLSLWHNVINFIRELEHQPWYVWLNCVHKFIFLSKPAGCQSARISAKSNQTVWRWNLNQKRVL